MIQAVILAAGMGTRLGRPFPKPLTPLSDGRTIMEQQIDNLRQVFGADVRITTVVGFTWSQIFPTNLEHSFVHSSQALSGLDSREGGGGGAEGLGRGRAPVAGHPGRAQRRRGPGGDQDRAAGAGARMAADA